MQNDRLPSISPTESVILDLLGTDERFGLEMSEASEGRVSRGSIYVLLARMEKKGFVESRQEERPPGAIGLLRRMYRATPYGLKVHQAHRLLREALALRPAEAQ